MVRAAVAICLAHGAQIDRLCLLALLTHPPSPLPSTHPLICSTCDIAGFVQNISQNQPVHLVAL